MPRTALFSPKLNTCKPDMKERKIISHTTGTRTRDLAIREQCSNQLSYSMTRTHSDGLQVLSFGEKRAVRGMWPQFSEHLDKFSVKSKLKLQFLLLLL